MVAGVIGMIPEGLVLLTSISFILGVGRLAKKNALVQEMEAIEALARVDVLCLDKTGTITKGAPEVCEVLVAEGASALASDAAGRVAGAPGLADGFGGTHKASSARAEQSSGLFHQARTV